MSELTHWKKLENPELLGSYAFQPGEIKELTISRVTRETVHGPDGKSEECTLLHFADRGANGRAIQPMVLNATNGKVISKLLGDPYIEHWIGKRIAIGVAKVKAFGDVVDGLRVQKTLPTQPKPEKATPCADCGSDITDDGRYTASSIIKSAVNRFGVALCLSCSRKRMEEAEHENNENQDQ